MHTSNNFITFVIYYLDQRPQIIEKKGKTFCTLYTIFYANTSYDFIYTYAKYLLLFEYTYNNNDNNNIHFCKKNLAPFFVNADIFL